MSRDNSGPVRAFYHRALLQSFREDWHTGQSYDRLVSDAERSKRMIERLKEAFDITLNNCQKLSSRWWPTCWDPGDASVPAVEQALP